MKTATPFAAIAAIILLLGLLGAASARADILYVANGANGTIEKFSTSNGADLGTFFSLPGDEFDTLAFDANTSPSDPSAGDLYASFTVPGMFSRLIKISPTGTLLSTINTTGAAGIAVDGLGNVYAALGGNTIEKYSSTGTDLGAFATIGTNTGLKGLAFDSAGNLYAVNFTGSVIDKITPSGSVSTFASGPPLSAPIDLAFDRTGKLYVTAGSSVIQYSSSGTLLGFWGGTANSAEGLAFDRTGQLYVASPSSNDIEKTSATGTDLGTFGSDPHTPNDLAFTDNLGHPLLLPGGEAVPEPATWAAAAFAVGMLTVQILRSAAFSKRAGVVKDRLSK